MLIASDNLASDSMMPWCRWRNQETKSYTSNSHTHKRAEAYMTGMSVDLLIMIVKNQILFLKTSWNVAKVFFFLDSI